MDQTKLKTKSLSTKAFSSDSGSENAEPAFTIMDYNQRRIRCRERCVGENDSVSMLSPVCSQKQAVLRRW